jgi:hypothetical protein
MAEPTRTTDKKATFAGRNRIADFGKNTRFKKGKSGNPTGRPKQSESHQLLRRILMSEAGRLRG